MQLVAIEAAAREHGQAFHGAGVGDASPGPRGHEDASPQYSGHAAVAVRVLVTGPDDGGNVAAYHPKVVAKKATKRAKRSTVRRFTDAIALRAAILEYCEEHLGTRRVLLPPPAPYVPLPPRRAQLRVIAEDLRDAVWLPDEKEKAARAAFNRVVDSLHEAEKAAVVEHGNVYSRRILRLVTVVRDGDAWPARREPAADWEVRRQVVDFAMRVRPLKIPLKVRELSILYLWFSNGAGRLPKRGSPPSLKDVLRDEDKAIRSTLRNLRKEDPGA